MLGATYRDMSQSATGAEATSTKPARTLPASAYSSRLFQAEEDAAIWSRLWVCVGFAADIPQVGDVLPFTAGHHGVHLERLASGDIVGRFNKAQHGGCRSVPLQCQTGTKTRCSFTSCGYSRDRGAISVEDPDRLRHLDQYLGLRPERLLPVAVQTWGPLLVARLDPNGDGPLSWPAAETLIPAAYTVSAGETVWREFACNWKHLAVALGEDEHVTDRESALLFPNLVLSRSGGSIIASILQPIALDRTLCRIHAFRHFSQSADQSIVAEAVQQMVAKVEAAEAVRAAAPARCTEEIKGAVLRNWFESKLNEALDVIAGERPSASLYRANERRTA